MADLTASELAERLNVSRRHATDLLTQGVITGRRLSSGMWLANSDSVLRYESGARRGKGRRLDAATAWGVLWELSGLHADWLTASSRSRVRARIRNSNAEQLARAVASRSRAQHFRAANAVKAGADLVTTGRAAAGVLGVGLMDDERHVCGYVRRGEIGEYARSHFMTASPDGQDVVYDNTLPVRFDGDVMPAAVIAADLAVSTDTRERSGGLRALEQLRQAWLDATLRV